MKTLTDQFQDFRKNLTTKYVAIIMVLACFFILRQAFYIVLDSQDLQERGWLFVLLFLGWALAGLKMALPGVRNTLIDFKNIRTYADSLLILLLSVYTMYGLIQISGKLLIQ